MFQSAPYVMTPEGGGPKEGFIIDLLEAMEVDYQIVSPADRRYGKKENGKWNGMVGMVVDGVSIFTGCPMEIVRILSFILRFFSC